MSLRVPVSGRVPKSGRVAVAGRQTHAVATRAHDTLRKWNVKQPDLVADWWLDDASGIYAAVHNNALAEGRNLVLDGDFATDTIWVKGTGWTISGGAAHAATAASGQNLTQSIPIVPGKIYKTVYTISNYSAGSVRIVAGSAGNGTTRSANGTYTEYLIAATNTTLFLAPQTTLTCDIDDVSVTEVLIPASSEFPKLELVKNPGFDVDGVWTKGTGWTIAGGVATHASGSSSSMSQALSIIIGRQYDVTFTVVGRTTGTMTPILGNTGTGTARSTNSTFTETITCAGNTTLSMQASSTFDGSIDNVSVVPHDGLVVWNGDGSTTTGWTAANSATLSSVAGWLRIARNGVNTPGAQQGCLKVGSTYHLVSDVRSDGSATPSISVSVSVFTGTISSTHIDIQFTATVANVTLQANTSVNGQYCEFQNLVITEIPPMSAPVSGALLNQTSGNALLDPVMSFDGINDFVNIYSGGLNSRFNPNEGTLVAYAKVANAGVWTDGATHTIVQMQTADGLNFLVMSKNAANNNLRLQAEFAGTLKAISSTLLNGSLGWFMVAITWSKTNDQFNAYINGTLVSTQTGLGTWVGNLNAANCVIGAASNAGSSPWSGYICQVKLFNTALSAARIRIEAELGGVI